MCGQVVVCGWEFHQLMGLAAASLQLTWFATERESHQLAGLAAAGPHGAPTAMSPVSCETHSCRSLLVAYGGGEPSIMISGTPCTDNKV